MATVIKNEPIPPTQPSPALPCPIYPSPAYQPEPPGTMFAPPATSMPTPHLTQTRRGGIGLVKLRVRVRALHLKKPHCTRI